MDEEAEEEATQTPLKYISNILELLQKVNFSIEGIKASKLNQIFDQVYEGGKLFSFNLRLLALGV